MDAKAADILLSRRHALLRHVIIQAVVLIISSTMLWDEPDAIMADRINGWLLYFLQIDLVVYGNMMLLVPRLLAKGKVALYFFMLGVLIFGSILGVGQLQPPSDNPNMGSATDIPPLIAGLSAVMAFYLFILGLTTIQLLKYRLENIRKIDALNNATMRVELDNLRNQINPHFLFNMLNNANIMAGEDVEKSAFILNKLNALLHYQIEEGSKKTIVLANDIMFLDDYLSLEKLRRDKFDYTISIDGPLDVEVPPLLFIPFVENAVKHNPESGSYVNLRFDIENGWLFFQCKNPIAKMPRQPKPGGIGLANIKRRLGLLFGKNHHLDTCDDEGVYEVMMAFKI